MRFLPQQVWFSAAILVILAGWLPPAVTTAQDRTKMSQDDIEVEIDAAWPDVQFGGYDPIRLTILNRGPDAHLRILATKPKGYGGPLEIPTVEKNLSVAQNAKINLTFLLPVVAQANVSRLQFYKDGKLLDQIRYDCDGSYVPTDVTLSLLVISGNRPNFGGFEAFARGSTRGSAGPYLPSSPGYSFSRGGSSYGGFNEYTFEHIVPADAPDTWLAYTGIDVVAIDAEALSQEFSPTSLSDVQRNELMRWVRSGGNLIINRAGSLPATLKSVEQTLNLHQSSAVSESWIDGRMSGLHLPTLDVGRNRIDDPEMKRANIQLRGLMFGQIVVSEGPIFGSNPAVWSSIYRVMQDRNYHWVKRNGFSSRVASTDFLKFVMEGIQIVPTWGFIALITLFAVIIGPINYYVLRRKHKIGQLLWTTPLIALVTSLALFAYSSIANGTATRVRLRSLTMLDQRDQTAVSLTRAAIFSGVSPRAGLRFDPNTAVYPIWQENGSFQSGHVDWTDSQVLTGSFHRGNTRSQFFLTTPRTERGRLQVGDVTDGKLPVTNGLEWNIEWLLVKGPDGAIYFGRHLDAGQSARLSRATPEDIDLFENRIDQQELKAPRMAAQPDTGMHSYSGSYPYYYQRSINTNFGSGHMERHLSWLKVDLNRQDLSLPAQSYAAVLQESPKLDLGITRYRTVEELHVLLGFY